MIIRVPHPGLRALPHHQLRHAAAGSRPAQPAQQRSQCGQKSAAQPGQGVISATSSILCCRFKVCCRPISPFDV